MATWVCRSGSPARLSRWVNAAASSPRVSTWATPLRADAGVGGVLLDPPQRVGDGVVVGLLDDVGDRLGGDRPQRGHALDRAEGQVVPGHRGGLLAGDAGQVTGQFAGVDGLAAVLFGEHAAGELAADPGAILRRDRGVTVAAVVAVVVAEGARRATVEHPCRLVDAIRRAEAAGCVDVLLTRAGGAHPAFQLAGVRVPALPEQRLHLRLGDVACHRKIWHGGKTRTHPDARGFTLLGVVGAQGVVAAVGGVVRSHLSGQVRVPVARGELVHRHGHTRRVESASAKRSTMGPNA